MRVGAYERDLADLFKRILNPGMTILDCTLSLPPQGQEQGEQRWGQVHWAKEQCQ
jgi:hypothetical protein